MAKRKTNKNRIPIKSPQDIKEMRVATETASEILQATAKFIEAGKTTSEVDLYAAGLIKDYQY